MIFVYDFRFLPASADFAEDVDVSQNRAALRRVSVHALFRIRAYADEAERKLKACEITTAIQSVS